MIKRKLGTGSTRIFERGEIVQITGKNHPLTGKVGVIEKSSPYDNYQWHVRIGSETYTVKGRYLQLVSDEEGNVIRNITSAQGEARAL